MKKEWRNPNYKCSPALPRCNSWTSIHHSYVVSLLLSSSSLSLFQLSSNTTLFFSYSYSYAFHLLHFTTLYPFLRHKHSLPVPRFQWLHVSLPSLYFLLFLLIDWLTNYELLLQKGRKVFFHTPFSVHSFLFCMCFAVSEAVWLMWYQNWYIFFHLFYRIMNY